MISTGADCFRCENSNANCDRLLDMLQTTNFSLCKPYEDSCRIEVDSGVYPIVGVCTQYCSSTSQSVYCVSADITNIESKGLARDGNNSFKLQISFFTVAFVSILILFCIIKVYI